MAKLVLGNAPKNFNKSITIELLDGSTADIEMKFKYRTRKEYAALLDAIMQKEAPKKGKKAEVVEESISEVFARLGDGTADFILDIADGWDLDDAFNKESVIDLIDKFPAATNAISEAYRIACLEGRLGN